MPDSPDAVVGEMNEERDGTCPVAGVTHRAQVARTVGPGGHGLIW